MISGGDNVAPARVEGFLLLQPEDRPGDGRSATSGPIWSRCSFRCPILPDALKRGAKANGKPAEFESLARDAQFHDHMSKAVERVNLGLSQIERVRRFVLAPEAFTTENAMLTPSMKIRRHVIRKAYGEALEALYARK